MSDDANLSPRVIEARAAYRAFMRLGWGVTGLFVLMYAGIVIYF